MANRVTIAKFEANDLAISESSYIGEYTTAICCQSRRLAGTPSAPPPSALRPSAPCCFQNLPAKLAYRWREGDTLWIDGSRLDNGGVGAACAWKTPGWWTSCRFHLGTNKEAFDAEVYAIYQALSIKDRRQESGHRYTPFVDPTFAIDKIRSDALGPRQRFAVASIEVCARIKGRNNEVMICWVPAHQEIEGNEEADKLAKAGTGREGAPAAPSPTSTDRRRAYPT